MNRQTRIDHLQERLDALKAPTLRSEVPIEPHELDELSSALTALRLAEAQLEQQRAELERARAELELERARCRDLLTAAERTKDEFLTIISHELRTPLNVVLGWTFRLRSHDLDADQSEKAVDCIDRNARRELRLVEELLDSARSVTGRFALALDTHELGPLLQDAIETLSATAATKTIAITSDIAANVYVRADRDRIHQIACNLLSNAVKFTPRTGQVRVTLADDRADAIFAVADTGIGIQPPALTHLFEPFWQAEGLKRRARSGLGLGLPLVKYLVELHGGRIEAASPGPALGSTFTVRLPLAAASPVRQ
jgi:signal transduction histidine kinase